MERNSKENRKIERRMEKKEKGERTREREKEREREFVNKIIIIVYTKNESNKLNKFFIFFSLIF